MALLIVLGIAVVVFVIGYFYSARAEEDQEETARLVTDNGFATVLPGKEYLDQFEQPIWEALKLDQSQPGKVISGTVGSMKCSVIQLEHGLTGLLTAGSPEIMRTTTVFVAELPYSPYGWDVGWQNEEYRVWADKRHLYLAKLNEKIPAKHWMEHLHLLSKVAATARERSKLELEESRKRRVWNVQDRRWVAFWAIPASVIVFISCVIFANELQDLLSKGQISICREGADYANILAGGKAWTWLGLHLLPLVVVAKMIYTVIAYYHKEKFVLRLNLDGFLLIVATAMCLGSIEQIERRSAGADQVQEACQVK